MKPIFYFLIAATFLYSCDGKGRFRSYGPKRQRNTNDQRHGKFLPVFNVIRFSNDVCVSTGGRNGTCYTAEECTSRSGTSSGSCAQGFGVCCLFSLTCGQTSAENCTYITMSSVTSTSPDPCTYTICRCSSDVCRIRFDFMTFNIAAPVTGTTTPTADTTVSTNGDALGDCLTDAFSITAPGNVGTPIICGFNTGQHMILDASDECNAVTFNLGSGSNDARSWDIKVTQFNCGNEDIVGPDGCLQFFTGTSGTISSFNYPTTDTAVSTATTHLSNQCYDICIRRESGYCAICYIPAITDDTPGSSFGLSISPTANAAQSRQGTDCDQDYIVIPSAQALPLVIGTFTTTAVGRLCGRILNAGAGNAATASVCSQTIPFKVTVKFDATEMTAVAPGNMLTMNEQNGIPGGIYGFSLNYAQQMC